jgi:SET domain-containing protein
MTTVDLPFNAANVVAATGLMVRPSTVEGAGLGLFAVRAFARDEVVAVYTGVLMTAEEIREMASFGDDWPDRYMYVMEFPDHGVCLDIAGRGLPVHYINDNRDRSKINTTFVKRERLLIAELVALRDIDPGEELFVDYGPQFWTGSRVLR